MSENIFSIGKGAEGLFVKNERFNTTLLSFHFYLPLDRRTISQAALLPFVLTTCSQQYRDYTELNLRLLELYGAELSCAVTKFRDCLHIRMSISVLDDGLAFEQDRPTRQAAELLLSLIFSPAAENGEFFKTDVDREKRKTIERIEGEINNKRSFAKTRLYTEMFGEDPYGVFEYGTVEGVSATDGKCLYQTWENLLKTGFIRFHVIGKSLPDGIFEAVAGRLSGIDRTQVTDVSRVTPLSAVSESRTVTERYNVTQGKLVMGFSSEVFGGGRESLPLLLCTDIFGGGPYSKLFSDVREKQSLCYYCSASAVRNKGFVVVDSGIEEENAGKVLRAVLDELDGMKAGKFDDFQLEASRKSISDTLLAYYDNAAAIDAWYAMTAGEQTPASPEEIAGFVKEITRDEIVAAARGIRLHTVYRLLPESEESADR